MLSACSFHPILSPLAFLFALAFGLVARDRHALVRSLAWVLPFVVLVAVLNPFISGQGATLIATVFGRPIYLEGMVFGLCMSSLMAAMLVWAQNAASTIGTEAIFNLMGSVAPTVALMLSMFARLVPRYIRQGRSIAMLEAANTATARANTTIAHKSRRFTALFGAAMEDSLSTALL